ncbi:hypothetical protein LUZ63_015313 [Rhynchospora breviuscula]|uniref:RNase H type-1 domain-containing protein n=1 Tax=Rhynchospora breviuscula TaxID=2022672 RepID=A0A9Q0CC29_9POAL|nr:hypothetical protein LUZ63_015313 [Rhynchospora breviuscula]
MPPPCELCGLEEDDVMHVLFRCEMARNYWFSSCLAIRTDALPAHVTPTLQLLLSNLGESGFAVFANLIWSLWKARCKQVYEGTKISITHTLGMATSYDRLAHVAGKVSHFRQGPAAVTVVEISSSGRVCTMDGSFKEGDLAGWAYMMYEDGRLVAYEMFTGAACLPLHAEAHAFHAAMRAVQEEGWSDVTFYTDSQILVGVLNGSLSPDSIDWRIYVQIVQLISDWGGNDGFSCVAVSRDLLPTEHGLANLARIKGLSAKGFTLDPWVSTKIVLKLKRSVHNTSAVEFGVGPGFISFMLKQWLEVCSSEVYVEAIAGCGGYYKDYWCIFTRITDIQLSGFKSEVLLTPLCCLISFVDFLRAQFG